MTLYGNTLATWALALGAALVVFAGLYWLRRLLLRGRLFLPTLEATGHWFLALVALWAGSLFLRLPEPLRAGVGTAMALVTFLQMGIWASTAISDYVAHHAATRRDDPASVATVRALGVLGSLVVWAVLVLMGLSNLGINVTAVVAGLGIGGVAVALAVQNILGDLFASLSIVLDKPFRYGDFISVGEMSGTVEEVGLKTTRLRSISGEQLIFSNSDLLQSRIRNYKRMQERRIVATFGVSYRTPRAMLEAIPGMIRAAVEGQRELRFDRAHFKSFGPAALEFEYVYFVLTPDYQVYMDRQQAVNLAILTALEEGRIELIHPAAPVLLERAPLAD